MKSKDSVEIWAEHPYFTNYEGSNFGRIRRKETKKIRKQSIDKIGRYFITLRKNGKLFTKYSHRFICECFYGFNKNLTVDHIDSNPSNNELSNLRYLPFIENVNNPNTKKKRIPSKTNSRLEKVKCFDLNGNFIKTFNSAKEAIEILKLTKNKRSSNHITNVCRGLANSAYGYKWEYVEEKKINGEIFKKHPYLNIEVSNFGRVKIIAYGGRNRITKGSDNTRGYLRITIGGKQYFVHRLVAETFIPNPSNKLEVNHKNSNTKDNKAENLEWVTRQENMLSENTHSKTSYKVDLYNLNGEFIDTYSSLTQMCKKKYLDLKCVRMCLSGKFKQHHGYTFKYHENNCNKENSNETNKD